MISTALIEGHSTESIEPRTHRQSRFPWVAEVLGWFRSTKPETVPASTERHGSLGLSTSERNIIEAMRQARLSQPGSNFMEARAEQLRQAAAATAPTDDTIDELVANIYAAYYETTPSAQ